MAITSNTNLVPNAGDRRRVVGVFKHEEDVEHVIRALKDADYDMDRVSLLARNVDRVEGADELQDHGNEAKEGAGIGASTGTVLGGVTGFLIGVGLLAIPGVGPILAAGAEIATLGSTLAGAGIGAATGGIIGALIGLGIPEERARVYENRIKAGDYLLMVSGDEDKISWLESLMRDRHAEELEVFGTRQATAAQPAANVAAPMASNVATENRVNATDRDTIRLHEERLVADKERFKTGEVAVGKRVETKTEEVAVPVQKERVVIEAANVGETRPVAKAPNFEAGEVARTETYAERADIHKEAFVREEVDVRKEVDRDVVTGTETLRREELDVDTTGKTNVIER